MSVDPKVVSRMSESRTSSDSILPKLQNIAPVKQKSESEEIEQVVLIPPNTTKPVKIKRKANKQLAPSGIPAPKFEITAQMRN
jgi:hypothetical protein